MYRDEEQGVQQEYEDLRKSKCFNPNITSPYYAMPCPMQMQPMMQDPYQSTSQCPVCGKSTKWRDDENFDLEYEDDRDPYSNQHYHHNYKPYYPPYYPPYYHPYHPYGPWWMKRDFEE